MGRKKKFRYYEVVINKNGSKNVSLKSPFIEPKRKRTRKRKKNSNPDKYAYIRGIAVSTREKFMRELEEQKRLGHQNCEVNKDLEKILQSYKVLVKIKNRRIFLSPIFYFIY